MKFLVALLFALSLTFAWQSAVFADNHDAGKESVEKAAEKMKDGDKEKKKKGDDEEDPDCE